MPIPDATPDPPEIVVRDLSEVEEAWEAVDGELGALGYHRVRRVPDGWLYRSEVGWKPDVTVSDDALLGVHRRPPTVTGIRQGARQMQAHRAAAEIAAQGGPKGAEDVAWLAAASGNYQVCANAGTVNGEGVPEAGLQLPLCVSVGGWLVGRAHVQRAEAEVRDNVHDAVAALGDALAAEAATRRAEVELPAELAALWEDPHRSWEEKRESVYRLWDSRTDTFEGDLVRAAVERFILAVVQTSDHPYTREELDRLDAARVGPHSLDL